MRAGKGGGTEGEPNFGGGSHRLRECGAYGDGEGTSQWGCLGLTFPQAEGDNGENISRGGPVNPGVTPSHLVLASSPM